MRLLLLLLAVVPLVSAANAQTAPAVVATAPLQHRADSLIAVLAGGGDTASVFAPQMLAQLPEAQIRAVAKHLIDGYGKPLGIATFATVEPQVAKIGVRYERGTVDMILAIEPSAPYRLIGLRVTGTASNEASLDQVATTIAHLPGVAGFALSRLAADGPVPVKASNADRDFAIGSAFKLAILSELIRATNAGERHWDDLITLDGTPLPGGLYTQKPAGTRVTLRELAQKMISVSDNSATDILLATFGRDRVEAMLPVIGWRDAARNRPLLGTLELFKLKGANAGTLGTRWLALDERGRRALLAGDISATPIGAIDQLVFQRGTPVQLGIEWFASPDDMIRTMDWIRRNTETGAGAEARAILGINPGIGPARAARWSYVGYKGGAEPGVIELTLLLRSTAGAWYALAASWNNPAAAIDEERMVALVSRTVDLIDGGVMEPAPTAPASPASAGKRR